MKVNKHILLFLVIICKVFLYTNFILILIISVRVYTLRNNNLRGDKYYLSLDSYKYVNVSSLQPFAIKSIIALEDPNFFYHLGIDKRLFLSTKTTSIDGTITQQVAWIFWGENKNFVFRYIEIITAIEIEIFLSKSRILELYLNNVRWVKNIVGIYAASMYNFKIPPQELNCEQTDKLMEILANPFK